MINAFVQGLILQASLILSSLKSLFGVVGVEVILIGVAIKLRREVWYWGKGL